MTQHGRPPELCERCASLREEQSRLTARLARVFDLIDMNTDAFAFELPIDDSPADDMRAILAQRGELNDRVDALFSRLDTIDRELATHL